MDYGINCNNGYCVNNNEQFRVINNNNNDQLNKYIDCPMVKPYNLNIQKPAENYGKALLLLNKTAEKIEPSELIFDPTNDIETIKGERIYGSDGKLVAIVDNNDDSKTIYTLNEDNKNQIDNIKVTDQKTGKTIKEQNNKIKENGLVRAYINEYLGNSRTKMTVYVDNKAESVSLNKENNREKAHIYRDLEDKYIRYHEEIATKNGYISNNISLENNFNNIRIFKETGINNKKFSKKLQFKDGTLISINNENRTTMPNTMGLKEISDKNLEPTSEFNIKGIKETLKNVDGIRTHYSNGKLESIEGKLNGKGIIANFDINGDLNKVLFEKVTVEILDNEKQKITETLEDGSKKTTTYYKDGISVEHEQNNIKKEISMDNNNNVNSYYETTKLENGKENEKSMYFNKNGFIEDCYEFEKD